MITASHQFNADATLCPGCGKPMRFQGHGIANKGHINSRWACSCGRVHLLCINYRKPWEFYAHPVRTKSAGRNMKVRCTCGALMQFHTMALNEENAPTTVLCCPECDHHRGVVLDLETERTVALKPKAVLRYCDYAPQRPDSRHYRQAVTSELRM